MTATVSIALALLFLAAVAGLLVTSVGAITAHANAGDPPKALVPATVGLVSSGAVVALQAA